MDSKAAYNHSHYLIRDRYDESEYLIDRTTYLYIKDLVEFYQQSIYEFPDGDRVPVQKIDHENKLVHLEVSINRLVFD